MVLWIPLQWDHLLSTTATAVLSTQLSSHGSLSGTFLCNPQMCLKHTVAGQAAHSLLCGAAWSRQVVQQDFYVVRQLKFSLACTCLDTLFNTKGLSALQFPVETWTCTLSPNWWGELSPSTLVLAMWWPWDKLPGTFSPALMICCMQTSLVTTVWGGGPRQPPSNALGSLQYAAMQLYL